MSALKTRRRKKDRNEKKISNAKKTAFQSKQMSVIIAFGKMAIYNGGCLADINHRGSSALLGRSVQDLLIASTIIVFNFLMFVVVSICLRQLPNPFLLF